jgi:hypothetical protein
MARSALHFVRVVVVASLGGVLLSACLFPGFPLDGSPNGAGADEETRGCPAGAVSSPPPGSAVTETVDLDGDDRRDRLWFAPPGTGGRTVGVTTATGATSSAAVPLAGPVPLRALAVDADEMPPIEILVSDHRGVLVFVFLDCAVQLVRDPGGDAVVLELGFRQQGTGVGCVDADQDGRRDLVTLLRDAGVDGHVPWSRTIVQLDGSSGHLGATESGTYVDPDDNEAIELLSTVTCGDRRIDEALEEPRP